MTYIYLNTPQSLAHISQLQKYIRPNPNFILLIGANLTKRRISNNNPQSWAAKKPSPRISSVPPHPPLWNRPAKSNKLGSSKTQLTQLSVEELQWIIMCVYKTTRILLIETCSLTIFLAPKRRLILCYLVSQEQPYRLQSRNVHFIMTKMMTTLNAWSRFQTKTATKQTTWLCPVEQAPLISYPTNSKQKSSRMSSIT